MENTLSHGGAQGARPGPRAENRVTSQEAERVVTEEQGLVPLGGGTRREKQRKRTAGRQAALNPRAQVLVLDRRGAGSLQVMWRRPRAKDASSPGKLGEAAAPRRSRRCPHLTSGSRPPELCERTNLLSETTRFARICHGGPQEQIHWVNTNNSEILFYYYL